jgi:hypothetical protein
VLNVLDAQLPSVDGQPAPTQRPGHEVLRGRLLAAQRGQPGQIGEKADLVVEAVVDGAHELVAEIWGKHGLVSGSKFRGYVSPLA